jgi:hypothetical protein
VGCNCGGKRAGVKYEVTLADGQKLPTKYASVSEAQTAGSQSGQTYTFKAVAA